MKSTNRAESNNVIKEFRISAGLYDEGFLPSQLAQILKNETATFSAMIELREEKMPRKSTTLAKAINFSAAKSLS